MANITIRIDDDTKKQLQELMTELGLDITTYFTMAAKQAIRERRIPFEITTNTNKESTEEYKYSVWTPDGRCWEDRMTLPVAEEFCRNTKDFVVKK